MRRNWRPMVAFIFGVVFLLALGSAMTGCQPAAPRRQAACQIAKKETETKHDSRGRETNEYEFNCTDGREIKVTLVTYNAYKVGQVYS